MNAQQDAALKDATLHVLEAGGSGLDAGDGRNTNRSLR
jgi:hypothetical protein